uniref:Uncharacterized protein n=1 Tax=Arundo donax TaxID=35708 RepID=A0A0A9EAF3_ARUDO
MHAAALSVSASLMRRHSSALGSTTRRYSRLSLRARMNSTLLLPTAAAAAISSRSQSPAPSA